MLSSMDAASTEDRSSWDIEPMVEQVWKDLGGTVPRSAIRQTVAELFAQYDDATVRLYVPILVRREATESLREAKVGIGTGGS